jgi:hypothetical protein
MKYLPVIMLFVLWLALPAEAQQGTGGKVTAEVIASSSTAVVKGAPFSAEAVSESVQTLADGNKIARSYTTRMFRDSEGRFRREEVPGAGGSVGGTLVGMQQTVSIFDPVSNVRYLLNPASKTARRLGLAPGAREGAVIVNGQAMSPSVRMQIETSAAQRTQVVVVPSMAPVAASGVGTTGAVTVVGGGVATVTAGGNSGKSEPLGTRDFEGVGAEGMRTTTTIPAGTIGNERPIEIVYERWYSKELQMIVYSKHSDPRFGEHTYRLTNIDRGEPDRSLFTLPSDYKVVSESSYTVTTKPQQ